MDTGLKNIHSKTPNRLLMLTSYTILISSLVLIVLSFFISYNDIVYAQAEIYPKNPFSKINTREQSILSQLRVKHGDTVSSNQILAILDNSASSSEVLSLKKRLTVLKLESKEHLENILSSEKNYSNYGEIQPYYFDFITSVQDYLNNEENKPLYQNVKSLDQRVYNQEMLVKDQMQKLNNYSNIVSISKESLLKNQQLFNKGVISENDYLLIQESHYQKLNDYSELSSNIQRNKALLTELKATRFQTTNDSLSTSQRLSIKLEHNYKSLLNAITSWERKYVLKSTMEGILTYNMKLQENQFLPNELNVFTIYPKKVNSMIGTAIVNSSKSGKVKVGQDVFIKLDNLPSSQYGKFKATVTGISKTPSPLEKNYTVFFELNDLNSTYGYKLDSYGTLIGTSEIITEKLSLAERLLFGVRRTFQRRPENL